MLVSAALQRMWDSGDARISGVALQIILRSVVIAICELDLYFESAMCRLYLCPGGESLHKAQVGDPTTTISWLRITLRSYTDAHMRLHLGTPSTDAPRFPLNLNVEHTQHFSTKLYWPDYKT